MCVQEVIWMIIQGRFEFSRLAEIPRGACLGESQ
jgi:hypothetical protein